MKERLTELLGRNLGIVSPIQEIQKLHGNASYRTYFRILLEDGASFVLMAMPEGKMSVSEEITNLGPPPQELPYINVGRYLDSLGLAVPKIFFLSEPDRWLLLEDLGNQHFGDVVRGATVGTQPVWYQRAIDLLLEIQCKTQDAPRTTNCVAFRRSFDATLFNWEFNHFWEYSASRSEAKSQKTDEKLFKEIAKKITQELCQLPQCFVHRDYQSRNLMIHKDKLFLLDFQDALLGPYVYDLVSLLRDSYVALDGGLVAQLISYYCNKRGVGLKETRLAFDLQTVQRKLKDAGRFAYIDQIKKNPNFLPFISNSLRYVREALERLAEYKGLSELLERGVPSWRSL